ncbi:arrestin domain-containing protein 3-like [Agrilus planipennis]|uniref:Arrestin domain-containing protein 3-like n=1 Tax=Agrilus planipennis TaxID=224129 RepID=A0A7F5R9N5_AGRPL|nr:arrestin domain-containing protein 3-like [Agrilus planipennis]
MLEIVLDEPKNVYAPSQNVSGRVKVTIYDNPKKVKSLDFCCKGEAHTSWDRYEGKCNVKRENRWIIPYEGREEYFRIEKNLIGGKGSLVELQPGEHVYPFSCTLPAAAPSSFEGTKGFVRYTVKATLVRPWKLNYHARKIIKVVRPLDLNVISRLREPASVVMNKSFCCLWCKSGPLNVTLSLPYTGYTPGQSITATCEIDNGSDVDVEEIVFTLKQLVFYHSTNPWKESWATENRIAVKSHVQRIAARTRERFDETLIVPDVPPSHLTYCAIIDLDYLFHVMVKLSPFHTDMSSAIPLTIGSVPLEGTLLPFMNNSLSEFQPIQSECTSDSSILVSDNEKQSTKLSPTYYELNGTPQIVSNEEDVKAVLLPKVN